ncbi:MAG: CoB--CoM heterodisulfide reductase subunit C [Candidatus Altiarchaeales archaeon]|nr:MAG: CoB--CoM heterodisulfide reductase subunit C [Candidatus Altiarchaeales archaeon]RLI94893.1 MAG: CoB--CoM heterodisulfide reductase subunit C [Candidatus Altiarchaeales archaeon]RLI95400.1 MAG: CoB--CoM heterodisulfide reductase subunit C [Candidatus Altiarchaeales archaeon]HDO82027.1 4Fe-4S dicluster domain-containing protein [Candidatus Altiarchaeales archaeon]HEX54676.1 4Fe-4S dicluster domain-containing protein [Candidatus Altiarchaeales archaeon]
MSIRDEVLSEIDGETIVFCQSCGICTGGCPSARFSKYNPRRIIHKTNLNMDPGDDIWLCATCYTCQERCPRGIKITDFMNLLRRIYIKEKGMPDFIDTLIENLKNAGYTTQLGEIENKRRERMNLPKINTADYIKRILELTEG